MKEISHMKNGGAAKKSKAIARTKTKNQNRSTNVSKKAAVILFLIVYPLTVLIRYLLAIKTHYYTTVLIDEHLYYSIARSIANGEGLLFMGQPANYTSILYPLLISPIYRLFPEGTNFFRLIQLFNIFVMNLSIIPLFYLAKRISKNGKLAATIAVLSLFLPDMTLGGLILSESVLYPLFFTMAFCTYRYFADRRVKDLVWIGILGGLIFFTKPGQAVAAFVILLYAIIKGCRFRDKRSVFSGITGIVCTIGIYAIGILAIRLLFHQSSGVIGVYSEQLQVADSLHLWDFFRALILSPFYFILMCCGLLLMIPLLNMRTGDTAYRDFLTVVLFSIVALIIGTAWTVNRAEYMYSSIHTRYLAPFIPILLSASLVNEDEMQAVFQKKEKNTFQKIIIWSVTLYAVLCAVVFGINAGIDPKSSIISYMSLAALRVISNQAAVIVCTIIFILIVVLLALLIPHLQKKSLCRAAIVLIAVSFVVNTAFAYRYMYREIDPGLKQDSISIQSAIGDQEFIYVYATNKREYNAYLDPRTKKSVQMVYVNDLFNNTIKSDGIYEPFVPDVQRGTIPQYPTNDVSVFAIDKDAMRQLLLSEITVDLTKDTSTNIRVVSFQKGKRWVDAFLGGPVASEVKQGAVCYIKIFNPEWKSRTLTVSLELDIIDPTSFIIDTGDGSFSFDLPAGKDTYTISLTSPTDSVSFYTKDSDFNILSFRIE